MKRFTQILLALLLICFLSCNGGGGGDDDDDDGQTGTNAGVQGTVVDTQGDPLQSVTVTVVSGNTATTGADGAFDLAVPAGTDKIVKFSKTGYVATSKVVDVFSGAKTSIVTTMIQEAAGQNLNASSGGTINGSRNASMTAPPGVFVDKNGNEVSGDVTVSLTPLDPAIEAEARAYPGDMRGLTKDGNIVLLETFGVMDVTVRQNDEALQIKPGQTIEVQVPAPSLGSTPDTTPMWVFNADTGLWEESEEGPGTFNVATQTYTADIGHLSPLNCDKPIVPTCIHGKVVDSEGNPAIGALIQAVPDLGGISSDYTDGDGNFCMYVERNADMTIYVYTPLTDSCPVEMRQDNSCVTTRDLTSSNTATNAGYPADCSDNCKRIEPVIRTGDVDPGPLDEAACMVVAGVESPFAGTCAAGLDTFYRCFSPEGSCEYENNPLPPNGPSFELEFENGSKMESDFSLQGYRVSYYGSDAAGNPLCGTSTASASGGMSLTTASGQTYITRTTDDGGVEIECEGGMTFELNADQLDFLAGCGGSVRDDDSGVMCEARPGTYGADCTFGSDCTSAGLDCCGAIGQETCTLTSLCDIICADDVECDGTLICCSVGDYSACMPAEACP